MGTLVVSATTGLVLIQQSPGWAWLLGAAILLTVAVVGGAATVAEALHWRASRQHLGDASSPGPGLDAIVVLGYPSLRNGRPHPLQRWRVRIALRSIAQADSAMLVFTGAGRPGRPSEAEVMAGYARRLGVSDARIVVETEARNTTQNLEFSAPLIRDADRIAIASDPMHAARARRQFHALEPDLARRLVPAEDHRWFEHPLLKAATAAYELLLAARGSRTAASTPLPTSPTTDNAPATNKDMSR